MATVALTLKVMPTGPEVDREQLRTRIEGALGENIKLQRVTERPIAFGLVALLVQVTMEEGVANPDDLEEELEELEDVESVTVEEVGLV